MLSEKRLIDANAFLKALNEKPLDFLDVGGDFGYFDETIDSVVNEQPTVDAVEVVRCKDCKHYTEGMAIGMCKRDPERPLIPIPYNHYCGFAERKEDGKE